MRGSHLGGTIQTSKAMHPSQDLVCVGQTYWSRFRIIGKEIRFVFCPGLPYGPANFRLGAEYTADSDWSQFWRTCDKTGT
jgi:hypothetical protein